MKALLRGAVAASIALGCSGAAHAATLSLTSPAWVSTQNLGVRFKAPDLGALAPATVLHITLGLKGNMAGAAAEARHMYTKGDPQYHKFLTPAQFTAAYAPSVLSANLAVAYLRSYGMRDISVTPNRLLVSATTTAGVASKAFNTSLHNFNINGKAVYANVTAAQVPASLAGSVATVLGLENLPLRHFLVGGPLKGAALANVRSAGHPTFAQLRKRASSHATTADTAAPPNCNNTQLIAQFYGDYVLGIPLGSSSPGVPTIPGVPDAPLPFCYPGSFSATQYRLAYDDQGNPVNTNIAVADYVSSCVGPAPTGTASGDGCLDDVQDDLWEMDRVNGLAPTRLIVRNVGTQDPSTEGNSGEDEWDLDTQITVGIGGGAPAEYAYNDVGGGVPGVISAFATDNVAKFLNFSIGETESLAYLTGELQTTDFAAVEAVLQGQTITVSSGDTGSFGGPGVNGVPAGVPGINWPCDSTYVACVGGTSVLANANDGTYDSEIAWYSGGGGISNYEQQSPWQNAMMAQTTEGLGYGPGTRLVPDLSMNADLDTGMLVYVSGVVGQVGGTSEAAPMAEGVMARIQSASGDVWGDMTPALYQTYTKAGGGPGACLFNSGIAGSATSPAGCLAQSGYTPNNIGGINDIVIGENDIYDALPGYDLTTGIGTLDINKLFVNFGL